MAVDDGRASAVFGRPVITHRQAKLVGFTGCFAVEGELPDSAGGPADILLLHSRVGDNQVTAIEHVMADQAVYELRDLIANSGGWLCICSRVWASPCVI